MSKPFQWTDELVAEYSLSSQTMTIFEFKRSKEERIEVTEMYFNRRNKATLYEDEHIIKFNKPIPEEKYSAIKEAIEDVLNPDPDWAFDKMKELTVEYKKMTDVLRQKKYTEADIKDAIASVLVKEIKPFKCDTKLSLVDNYFNDWLKQRK